MGGKGSVRRMREGRGNGGRGREGAGEGKGGGARRPAAQKGLEASKGARVGKDTHPGNPPRATRPGYRLGHWCARGCS